MLKTVVSSISIASIFYFFILFSFGLRVLHCTLYMYKYIKVSHFPEGPIFRFMLQEKLSFCVHCGCSASLQSILPLIIMPRFLTHGRGHTQYFPGFIFVFVSFFSSQIGKTYSLHWLWCCPRSRPRCQHMTSCESNVTQCITHAGL